MNNRLISSIVNIPAAFEDYISIQSDDKLTSEIITSGNDELRCGDRRSLNISRIDTNIHLLSTDSCLNALPDPITLHLSSDYTQPLRVGGRVLDDPELESPAASYVAAAFTGPTCVIPSTVGPICDYSIATNCYVDTVSSIDEVVSVHGKSPDPQLYADTYWCPSLRTVPIYNRSYGHHIGALRSQMNLQTWLYELSFEEEEILRRFLTDRVTY